MQDYKMAAAGELSQPGKDRSDNPKKMNNGYSENELNILLDALVSVTQANLTGNDRIAFKGKLSMFPRWKLDQLINFNGRFISEIWHYMDCLNSKPTSTFIDYKKLNSNEPKSSVGYDVMKHIDALGNDTFKPRTPHSVDPVQYDKEHSAWLHEQRMKEKHGIELLIKKYPHLGFDKILKEKRFDGLSK